MGSFNLQISSSNPVGTMKHKVITSTAKQVLGNCERMVFASYVGNFNFDSFNPNFLFTCAVNFYLMICVVNLYIVLVC